MLRGYARIRTGPARLQPREWKRALIIGDNHIGDLLYRSCSLKALKAGLPNCELFYLAAPQTAAILEDNPYIARLLPWSRSDSPLDLSREHLEALRAFRFDAALCTNCIRYWPELLLAIRLGIPQRAGYVYKGSSGLITLPMPMRHPQSFPAYFRDYVSALTGQTVTGPLKPEIYISAATEAEAVAAWRRMGLAGGKPVVAFFLTSRQPLVSWPTESYRVLFEMILAELDVRVVLMGAKEDEALLRTTAAGFREPVPVCAGELGLRSLAAFLRRCRLVVAKDSGPRHIANAMGTPVLFFRSSSYSQVEAGRYCDTETDLLPAGEFLNLRQQRELLAQATPAGVFRAVQNALRKHPPRP